jgi:hypothetical protein
MGNDAQKSLDEELHDRLIERLEVNISADGPASASDQRDGIERMLAERAHVKEPERGLGGHRKKP